MRKIPFDKSSLFLLVIAATLVSVAIFLYFSLRSDAVDLVVKSDRILNLAFIVEREGKPISAQLFLFYPSNGRGALLDVPGETGLIIKSLNRVDRIDTLYDKRRPKAYIDEVSRLLAAPIPYWIILDERGLSDLADLVEGIEIFVPQPIDLPGPPRALLPSGALLLDGDKAAQYAYYKDPEESDADSAGRRQKLFQSLVRRIGEKASWLGLPAVFPAFARSLNTNLSGDSLRRLLPELVKLDSDRLVLQKVAGTYRSVDGKRLLFPHYDGELVRDIVKQTLNALSNSGSSAPADKIFTIEILNGTSTNGLAKKAAEIFQSFGYDVVSVGNADKADYAATLVLDHFSNAEASRNIAEVIRCERVDAQATAPGAQEVADFTIVLGKDFNGRYCVK
jgi:anionic cell wall polymer biosynthesis LytR-Cps2A-Psr (LCP) family protein